MAQGEVVIFDDAIEYLLKGNPDCPFDLGSTPDTFKCAIVNNGIVPSTTTDDPCWGSGGNTDLSTNEEAGGSMTAGGLALSSPAVSVVGGVPQIDMGDPATWVKNGSNPTACFWGIIYSDSATNKNCLGYIDLGGSFNATTGDLDIDWGAPMMTFNQ